MIHFIRFAFVLACVLSVVSGEAAAHAPGGSVGGGFYAGFMHPFGGIDHLLATLAVGAWIARLGRRAVVVVPFAVLAALGLGFAVGYAGVWIPAESGIVASLLALAAGLLFDLRPLPIVAAVAAGFFAFFHGHAHGTEIPAASEWAGFAAGLAAASVALMISGGVLSRMIGACGAWRRDKPEAPCRRDFEAIQRLK